VGSASRVQAQPAIKISLWFDWVSSFRRPTGEVYKAPHCSREELYEMNVKPAAWKAALSMLGVALGIIFGAMALIRHATVDPQAIQSSVIRTHEVIERAWKLPVAASFHHELYWQSNASLCGPASLANVFRSLGEIATTEPYLQAFTSVGPAFAFWD
jgi:hypothetical protein